MTVPVNGTAINDTFVTLKCVACNTKFYWQKKISYFLHRSIYSREISTLIHFPLFIHFPMNYDNFIKRSLNLSDFRIFQNLIENIPWFTNAFVVFFRNFHFIQNWKLFLFYCNTQLSIHTITLNTFFFNFHSRAMWTVIWFYLLVLLRNYAIIA